MSKRFPRLPFSGFPVQIVVAILGAHFALPALGQDLGALARKEKERRAKVATPARVYVEGDGKESSTGTKSGAVTTLSDPSASSTSPPAGSVSSPDEQKPGWKARADAARAAILEAEQALKASDLELETFRSDLRGLSAAEAQDPLRLQKREVRIRELVAKRDAQKGILANAHKALAALEGEARSSGIPPGWLR